MIFTQTIRPEICDPELTYAAPSALTDLLLTVTRPAGPGYYISRLRRWSINASRLDELSMSFPFQGRAIRKQNRFVASATE
jgi:hypothetical protein